MPRDGSGVASPPPGTDATPNTTILSSAHNTLRSDTYSLFNTAWPVALGGTGGTSPATARVALGLEIGVDIPSNAQLADVAAEASVETRRNRIVNHDMRTSQENGTSSGTANGYFAADQWATYRVTSAGTITSAQVASTTPAGSPNRYRVTITTADASLAAGEYLTISQNLEGSNVVDFQYGGASARNSVLRFGFKGPAGTYAVALHNSAANRSFVALFTIGAGEANTDTVQTISIPGDTTGTWLTADGVIGITLDIVLACGSTFQGVAGWQAGNILGTSAVSNGMATGSAVFELFDVGFRLDPDATGVYGQYEVGEVHPVYRSERYYEKSYQSSDLPGSITSVGAYYFDSIQVASQLLIFPGWKYEKAVPPNVVVFSTDTGAINTVRNPQGGFDIPITYSNISKKTFKAYLNGGPYALGEDMDYQYRAIARLS